MQTKYGKLPNKPPVAFDLSRHWEDAGTSDRLQLLSDSRHFSVKSPILMNNRADAFRWDRILSRRMERMLKLLARTKAYNAKTNSAVGGPEEQHI